MYVMSSVKKSMKAGAPRAAKWKNCSAFYPSCRPRGARTEARGEPGTGRRPLTTGPLAGPSREECGAATGLFSGKQRRTLGAGFCCSALSVNSDYRRQHGSGARAFDVVGLGQAMVDYTGFVSDKLLDEILGEINTASSCSSALPREKASEAKKGDRICVDVEQMGRVLNKLDSSDFKVTTGGSLSNTLVALSRLGSAPASDLGIKVGMAGLVGADPVGSFYRAKMGRAGVRLLSPAIREDATTGTVVVLTTPDAQRTMLSNYGSKFPDGDGEEGGRGLEMLSGSVRGAIAESKVLLVEGYLLECGAGASTFVTGAMEEAKRNGTMVCLTTSDLTVVQAHGDALWDAIKGYADIIFANSAEARALTGQATAEQAAAYLARHTRVVSCVTDGVAGSHLAGMGTTQAIPPYWMPKGPLDTSGAGDAYAAGAMYALLGNATIRGMGSAGARVSSTVIQQIGARLKLDDAEKLAEVLPMHMYDQSVTLRGRASSRASTTTDLA